MSKSRLETEGEHVQSFTVVTNFELVSLVLTDEILEFRIFTNHIVRDTMLDIEFMMCPLALSC